MTEQERKHFWAMFYLTVEGWRMHPGNKHLETMPSAAHKADRMLAEMEERWPTGQQQ